MSASPRQRPKILLADLLANYSIRDRIRPYDADCADGKVAVFPTKPYGTTPEQTATLNFQDRCLKPLGHPSTVEISDTCGLPDSERLGNPQPFGHNLDKSRLCQRALRQHANDFGRLHIGLLGPLRVALQHHCRIVTAACRDRCRRVPGPNASPLLDCTIRPVPKNPSKFDHPNTSKIAGF
jgi:hypothetical protein